MLDRELGSELELADRFPFYGIRPAIFPLGGDVQVADGQLSARSLSASFGPELQEINRACPIVSGLTFWFDRGEDFFRWPELVYDRFFYVAVFADGDLVGYCMAGLTLIASGQPGCCGPGHLEVGTLALGGAGPMPSGALCYSRVALTRRRAGAQTQLGLVLDGIPGLENQGPRGARTAYAPSRPRLTSPAGQGGVTMTTIIESPPGTTPGPAPPAPRPWWKKPLTWIITGIAIIAICGASLAAYAAVSGTTTVAPRPAATTAPATTSQPPTAEGPKTAAPAPTPTVTVTVSAPAAAPSAQQPAAPAPAAPALTNAVAVVQQFYQDITDDRYAAAWALGGKNLDNGVDYDRWVAGYATTASIDLTTYGHWSDGTVYASLTALQTDGTVRTYQGTYTVANGQIVSAHIVRTS